MPVDQFDRKWSCITCIRGHRTGECKHYDRYMVHVRHPGRPSTKCKHLDPFNCNCAGVYRAILVEWRKPEAREEGHKAKEEGYPQGKVVSIEVNLPADSNEIPPEKLPNAAAALERQPVFVGHTLEHFKERGLMKNLEDWWKVQQPKGGEAQEKPEQQGRKQKKHARRLSKQQQQAVQVQQQPLPAHQPSVPQQPLPEQTLFQQPQHLVPVFNVTSCNYNSIQPVREQGLPTAVHHSHQESNRSFTGNSTGPDGSHDGCCLSEDELEMHGMSEEELQAWQRQFAQQMTSQDHNCSCPPQFCTCVNCRVHSFNQGDMQNLVQNVLPHINPTEWPAEPNLSIEPNADGVLQPRYVDWPNQGLQQMENHQQTEDILFPSAAVGQEGPFGQDQAFLSQNGGLHQASDLQQVEGQSFMSPSAGGFPNYGLPAANSRQLVVNYQAAKPSCCPPDCTCDACSAARLFAEPLFG